MFKPLFGTPLNRSHPLAQGLAGCWIMNENSGKYVWDCTGNGNDGICTNMADPPTSTSGWGPGPNGGALAFDGSNDYFDGGSGPTTKFGTGPFSILLNVRPTSFASEAGLYDALTLGGVGSRNDAFILVLTTAGKLRVYRGGPDTPGGAYSASSNDALVLHSENSIVLVRSGAVGTFYINGIADSVTIPLSSNVTSGGSIIGRYADADGGWLTGHVSSASIYNRALSDDEVAYLYAFPYGMFEEESFPAWMRGRVFNPAWARGANNLIYRMAA
jgi:hypothetical protein